MPPKLVLEGDNIPEMGKSKKRTRRKEGNQSKRQRISQDDTSSTQNQVDPGTERPDGNTRSEGTTPPENLGEKGLQRGTEEAKPERKRKNKFTCYTERETVVKKTINKPVFTVKQMLRYMSSQREVSKNQEGIKSVQDDGKSGQNTPLEKIGQESFSTQMNAISHPEVINNVDIIQNCEKLHLGVSQDQPGLSEEGRKSGPKRDKKGVIQAKPGLKSQTQDQREELGVKGGVKGKTMRLPKVKINPKNTYKDSGQQQGHSSVDIQEESRPKPEEGVPGQNPTQKESE